MNITPIEAFDDNYIWLITLGNQAICVDPGDAVPVLVYCREHGLTPTAVWLTHNHGDHSGGVRALRETYPNLAVYGCAAWLAVTQPVGEGGVLDAFGARADVWAVPGHTDDHLAYILADGNGRRHVFCGDTLFSAGCGRVFTGTAQDLSASLRRIDTLPENTLLYPAHEYTLANLRFAQAVEPENRAVQAAYADAETLRRAGKPTLPTTLCHERAVNPFLRTREAAVRRAACAHGLPESEAENETAVFAVLRAWKDEFR